MSPRLALPHLYRVSIESVSGGRFVYGVCSWLGEAKAVAMAMEVHLARKRFPVYEVAVLDEGEAGQRPDGIIDVPSDYFDDRSEW